MISQTLRALLRSLDQQPETWSLWAFAAGALGVVSCPRGGKRSLNTLVRKSIIPAAMGELVIGSHQTASLSLPLAFQDDTRVPLSSERIARSDTLPTSMIPGPSQDQPELGQSMPWLSLAELQHIPSWTVPGINCGESSLDSRRLALGPQLEPRRLATFVLGHLIPYSQPN